MAFLGADGKVLVRAYQREAGAEGTRASSELSLIDTIDHHAVLNLND